MADLKPDNEKGMTFTAKVRILEAVCGLDYPNADEQNFRIAVMKSLGIDMGLAEMRKVTISGSGRGVNRPKEKE